MDGSGDRYEQLTDSPGEERQPSLSPDGRKVVYSVVLDGVFEQAQMMLLDLDTRTTTHLSKALGPGLEAVFGHDGKYVLYTSGGHVFRADLDGRDRRQLTFGRTEGPGPTVEDHRPIPSPDGRLIAFTRIVRGLHPAVYEGSEPGQVNLGYTVSSWVMHPDGTAPRELTEPKQGRLEFFAYAFAPTGIWLTYDRTATVRGGPDSSVWEMDVMSGQSRPLFPGANAGVAYTGWLR